MARKFQGIKAATYGTADPPATAINKLANEGGFEGCRMEFLDEENNPVDYDGNQYAGVLYALVVLTFLDATAGAAIRANRLADTPQFFKLTLDSSETATTDRGVLLQYCRPVNVQGVANGRADGWQLAFRIPYDDLTFA